MASICSGFLTVVILNIEYLLWQWSGNTTFVSLGIHFFIEIRNTRGSLESLVPRFNISIILHYKALAKRTRKSTCVQLAFRLATHVASTCINLRLLALTLLELKFGRKWTEVFYCSATQRKLTQIDWK